MPRIRSIKPDLWNDEKLGQESESVVLTFVAMWNFSDDYAVIKANPLWLKNQIFPYKDKLRIEAFSIWLKRLEELELIILFTYRGESFYYIRNFRRHQQINKPSKARNCPEAELIKIIPQIILGEDTTGVDYRSTTGVLPEYYRKEIGKGKGKGGGEESALTPEPLLDGLGQRSEHAPSWAAVVECFHRMGRPEEARGFFDYYEGLSWMKGITPIKNFAAFANRWASSELGQQSHAKKESGRKVIVEHNGGEVVWTEDQYKRYCNQQDPTGYTFIRYEL